MAKPRERNKVSIAAILQRITRLRDPLAAGRVSVHSLPAEDSLVKTTFIRRRKGFVSSALRAFLATTLVDTRSRT